jgi:type I restriction enzyme S subunit
MRQRGSYGSFCGGWDMPDSTVLADLIHPPRSGFWGSDKKGLNANRAARVVRNGDVGKDGQIPVDELPIRWFTPQEIEKAQLRPGDSVLVSSGAYTGNVGRVTQFEVEHPVVISNFVRLLRPLDTIDGGWLFRLSRSNSVQKMVWPHAGGSAIPNLSASFYSATPIAFVPPVEEQKIVSQIFDTLGSQIHQTEALIAKLERIKQGLLTDLLTRGIDQNDQLRPTPDQAPRLYKDSPLGRIPREWQTRSLGETLKLQRGFDITVASQTAGDYPVVSSSGITSYHNQYMIKGPGVVTGRKGKLGLTHYIESNFWPHDTSLWVKDFHGNNKKFAVILLDSLRLGRFDAATSVPTLNRNFVHPLLVSVPPVDEQQRIVEMKAGLEARTAKERSNCERLRTLKTGLMDDLLTGRVRVTPFLKEAQQRKG